MENFLKCRMLGSLFMQHLQLWLHSGKGPGLPHTAGCQKKFGILDDMLVDKAS